MSAQRDHAQQGLAPEVAWWSPSQAGGRPMSKPVKSLRILFSASTSGILEKAAGKVVEGKRADAVQNVVVRRCYGGAYQQVRRLIKAHVLRRLPVLTWNAGNSHQVSRSGSMNLIALSPRKLRRSERAIRCPSLAGRAGGKRTSGKRRASVRTDAWRPWRLPAVSKGRTLGLFWDFRPHQRHDRATAERLFPQVSDLLRSIAAGHGIRRSLPGHLRARQAATPRNPLTNCLPQRSSANVAVRRPRAPADYQLGGGCQCAPK